MTVSSACKLVLNTIILVIQMSYLIPSKRVFLK